jgi:hypothetical protein
VATTSFAAALAETVAALSAPEARESIAADPYWPKWDSPWWRMTALFELGLAREIPVPAVEAMVSALRTHYLPFLPLAAEELPPGADPHRHVSCHCANGTMIQVLEACGVDTDAELPWLRPWLLRYQLGDGGLNCDERAYTRPHPKSSVVSTLPPLEAVLRCTRPPMTEAEERFVDAGAGYLVAHRLLRRASGDGDLIDPAWLAPCFPRFYHYDLLRGLTFLARWAEVRQRPLPRAAVAEARQRLQELRVAHGGIPALRRPWRGARTLRRDRRREWGWSETAAGFPLLEEVGVEGRVSAPLTREHEETCERLARLEAAGLLVADAASGGSPASP